MVVSGGKIALIVLLVGAAMTVAHFAVISSSKNSLSQVEIPMTVVDAFNKFIVKYNKRYSAATDKQYRMKIFYRNYMIINEHNQDHHKTYSMEINHFADLDNEEFQAFVSTQPKNKLTNEVAENLPIEKHEKSGLSQSANFDYRNLLQQQSITTSNGCNDNYAWISAVNMNSNYYISRGSSIQYSFSPQTYIDCSANFFNQGCNGGSYINSYTYSMTWGIDTLSNYPYYGAQRPCRAITGYFKNTGIYQVASLSNSDLMNKLAAKNIISAGIDISGARFYSGGVFTGPCTTTVNQGVLLIGAGLDPASGLTYWLLMNTWGTFWGENGFMRIARFSVDGSRSYSSCGLNMYAAYPTFY